MEKDDHLGALHRQHQKYSAAIAEFEAIEAELRLRPRTTRTLDMIRLNQETIHAMKRSIELVEERIRRSELRRDLSSDSSSHTGT